MSSSLAGGMAHAGLGLDWQCLFANDFSEKKAASYAENWGDDSLLVGDVALLESSQLPSQADLAWASFPCQDLSLAGNGAGLNGVITSHDGKDFEAMIQSDDPYCCGTRLPPWCHGH